MPDIDTLGYDVVREALRLLDVAEPPVGRGSAARRLRELFQTAATVRAVVGRAPEGARAAFQRLAGEGPAAVQELLGRGWWGHGLLPPPLDWLQRRALITVADDGLVHAVSEARTAYLDLTLDLEDGVEGEASPSVTVRAARTVVVAPSADVLARAVAAPGAALREVAPTVALSDRAVTTVRTALRTAGLSLDDETVVAVPAEPALPGTTEEAVGPRAVRSLFGRAVGEARQVRITYYASSRGGVATERTVDPWSFHDDLLVGWCHLRTGERTFAVDRVGAARLLPTGLEHAAPQ